MSSNLFYTLYMFVLIILTKLEDIFSLFGLNFYLIIITISKIKLFIFISFLASFYFHILIFLISLYNQIILLLPFVIFFS